MMMNLIKEHNNSYDVPAIVVLNLGWGVQSWTLAAMVAKKVLPPVSFAIHSDTTWERENTYQFAAQWTPWLEGLGIKVVTVSDQNAARKIVEFDNGSTHAPLYTVNEQGSQGQLRRSCTHRWKIAPIRRYIAHFLALQGIPKQSGVVEQWLGITTDEWQRAKDSDVNYIRHRFPFLELGFSRQDCLQWLEDNSLPSPGSSSCVFCPYHTDRKWERMKMDGGPDWETALEVDGVIRLMRPGYESFVHQGRIPLRKIVIPEDVGYEQSSFLETDDSEGECGSGYCFM